MNKWQLRKVAQYLEELGEIKLTALEGCEDFLKETDKGLRRLELLEIDLLITELEVMADKSPD